jgi:Ca-activated chloride channel family protein
MPRQSARRALFAILLSSAAISACHAKENVMLVLDASGSMWGQIEGRSKIEIARDAVAELVAHWQPEDALGLMAYGHRRKGDCTDIETLVDVGRLDVTQYLATVNALNPKGMTPLSQAVVDAAAALRSSEQKATVILVSDGEETCDLDPCAIGQALEREGIDFTAHVIGFDVTQAQHQAQLRCLAENTGGRYFNARDAHELEIALGGALQASIAPALPPATASVAAQGSARITSPLSVRWTGPADKGDFITVVKPDAADGAYLTYAYVENKGDGGQGIVEFAMPAAAGSYELRYVSPGREPSVLARTTLTIDDSEAQIEAPASAKVGSKIRVVAQGPVGGSHWIGFAAAGAGVGAYVNGHYARPTGPRSELELTVPATPGNYELRYVLNESERVIASRPIRVEADSSYVRGPSSVMAGDTVTVEAAGPVSDSHWIGFAPAGSDKAAYVNGSYARPTGSTSTLRIRAPLAEGDYELRYVLLEGEDVAASQPIRVTAAQATVSAPTSVAAGKSFRVTFSGPRNSSHWIGVIPAGGDGSEYRSWSYLPEAGDAVDLDAPEETGAWDIAYVVDGQVLTRTSLQVQ